MQNVSLHGNWQLFLDNHIIARCTGFDRVIHHPRARGIVIAADKPWETTGVSLIHVSQKEDGIFNAYYNSMWWDCDRGTLSENIGVKNDRAHHAFSGLGFAESHDGVNWNKPVLGLVQASAETDWAKHAPFPSPLGLSDQNNLGCPFCSIFDLGSYGNVYDPAMRYAIGVVSKESVEYYFSEEIPDFIDDPHWKNKLNPANSQFSPRGHILQFWDATAGEWVSFTQGVVGHWIPSREIARFSSKDLKNWTSQSVLYPDCDDAHTPWCYDEPMGMTPFFAEGMLFGLLSWFHADRSYPDGGPVFDRTESNPNVWPWSRKGTNEMRLCVSRDGGKTWDRSCGRKAWIAHGTEEDSFDRLVIGAQPPIQVGDEDWFYMTVADGDHLSTRSNKPQEAYYHDRIRKLQTALYTQKHNRYVSLTAHREREILITKPFLFDGKTLRLNADASRGEIRVGIAPAQPVTTFDGSVPAEAPHLYVSGNRMGNAMLLPGFSFADCKPIYENGVDIEVCFSGDTNALFNNPISLFFLVEDADLYGFRII